MSLALWAVLAVFSLPRGEVVRGFPLGAAIVDARTAQASDSALEARTRAVASELRCPVCQGESIQDSPAALAQQMRAIVREQLAAGRTPDQVKAYFVDKYGEWILLRPKAHGWNVLVYVLPLLALLVGAAVITRAARRWTSRDTKGATDVQRETAET